MSPRARVLLLCAAAGALLIAHSLLWNFVTDDAFIAFVYAKNLAHHGELVFNLGERVEGYTNFLWTLLLAGLLELGQPPEITSRVLGTAAGVATLFVCAFASRTLRDEEDWSPWDALPAFLLAAVPGYACWCSGGLETQLFTLLFTLGAVLYLRGPSLASGAAFGLAALTRPEGLLFFALTAAHLAVVKLRRGRLSPTRAELAWAGAFLALVVPHFLWRRWYYGFWLPNTFYVKASGGMGAWSQGAYYLYRLTVRFHLWVVPPLVGAALWARRGRGLVTLVGYTAPVVAVFFVYVASIAGDFMGLFRFALPVVPLFCLCAALSLRELLPRARPPIQAVTVLVVLGGHVAHAALVDRLSLSIRVRRFIASPGYLRRYAEDRAAIGRWMAQYARPDDFAAVGGSGAQVYYSGIRSLDCFGLSDLHIAHEVPATKFVPGHEKFAPLEYELSKKPTIITSDVYHIGRWEPPAADAAAWLSRGYHYVTVEIPGLSERWYTFLLRNDRSFGPLPALSEEAAREP